MKTLALFFLAAFLVAAPPDVSASRGTTLRYGGGGQGVVVFDGARHAGKGFSCNDCHLQLFATAKQARITMAEHYGEARCFKCHDNKTASRDCVTCHRRVASSPLTASRAMSDLEAKPLPEGFDRMILLGGAQGASEQSRACLSCHGDPGLKPVTDRGKTLNLLVARDGFHKGTHGNLACTWCHVGTAGAESFAKPPHAVLRPNNAVCQACHNQRLATEIKGFAESNHAAKLKDKMVCADCHNPHDFPQRADRPNYPAAVALYNRECLSCHDNPARFKELSGRDLDRSKMAHGFMAKFVLHNKAIMCADCHTSAAPDRNGHQIMDRKGSLADCDACHRGTKPLIFTRAAARGETPAMFAGAYFPAAIKQPRLDAGAGYAFAILICLAGLHGVGRLFGTRKAKDGAHGDAPDYPRFVRLFHWINAALFLGLAATGLSVRFQDGALAIGLKTAANLHDLLGVLLTLNFAAYMTWSVASGDIRQYLPWLPGLGSRLARQARYYLRGIFKGEPRPFAPTSERRLNPLQQVAYFAVFPLGMPVFIVSGWLLLAPPDLIPAAISRESLALFHYVMALGFGMFFLAHLYLITTGDTAVSLLAAMLTGRPKSGAAGGEKRA